MARTAHGLPGVYNSPEPTLSNGDGAALGLDVNGNVKLGAITPGTGASNLGKAEDAAHASADVGVMGLAVRTDTPANRSGTDGDYEPLQMSAGRLWASSVITDVVTGTGASNLGKAEDAAHTSADVGVMALGVRNDAFAALSGTDLDYTPINTDSAGRVGIRGTYAEDAAHTTADAGVFMLAKRTDTAASSAGTDGDYCSVNSDSLGHVWMREGFAPGYENNTDNIAWTHDRPISSSTAAISVDRSTALEASTVTKASAGRIYAASVRIDSTLATGTYYWHFINAASLPADGAVTTLVAPRKVVHTSGTDDFLDFDFSGVGGVYASTGLVAYISTTEFSKTIGTAVTSSSIYYS